jgi:hypothetical protein
MLALMSVIPMASFAMGEPAQKAPSQAVKITSLPTTAQSVPLVCVTEPAKADVCHPKKKAVVHKKKVVHKKPTPYVQQVVAVPISAPVAVSTAPGCPEIRFTTKQGESAVKVIFLADDNLPRDDACPFDVEKLQECISEEMCNFSRAEKALGKKVQLVKSYPTTPGEHVLRVPQAFLNPQKGIITMLVLVRGDDPSQYVQSSPYSPKVAYSHNEDVVGWMKSHYSDGICVGYFDYTSEGIATVYHSKEEMPADTRIQMYFPPVGTSLF